MKTIVKMKPIVSTLVLGLLFLTSSAQTQKITVFCHIDPIGKVFYGNLAKFLPDSLKASVLVDARKEPGLRNVDNVLLWMSLNGWKVITSEPYLSGGVASSYLLSKDIWLDAAARASVMDKLANSEKKSH
jgi:hypothetical protein